MKHQNLILYKPILLLWLLIAIAVLLQAYFYPLAHFGYGYYGTAYNMWITHSYWYPSWLHSINVQKPPLFYWLTLLSWWLFGINHLIMPIIVLLCYLLTAIYSAKTCLIFTQNVIAAKISGILVLMNLVFLFYVTLIRFDIQLTFSVILAFYALSKILYENIFRYWWLHVFAVVLGLLFKGPVIFLFTLPAALAGLSILQSQYISKLRYLSYVLMFSLLAICITGIWLISANYHSQGIYLQTILQQTLQRLNHTHPDPYTPQVQQSFHWWSILVNFMIYFSTVFIIPFIFLVPPFFKQLYYGIKIQAKTPITIYFALAILLPIIIFAIFIGLLKYRYVLPLIPLSCIVFGYFISPALDSKAELTETHYYRRYLLVLFGLAIMALGLGTLIPAFKNQQIFLMQLAGALAMFAIWGWHAQNYQQRWQACSRSVLSGIYILLLTNLFCFYSLPTINHSAQKLQQLSLQKKTIIEVIAYTRRGWPQFLGRNMTISAMNFDQFQQLPDSIKKNSWIIFSDKLNHYEKNKMLYPLQFSTQNHAIPILMPYKVYQEYHHF